LKDGETEPVEKPIEKPKKDDLVEKEKNLSRKWRSRMKRRNSPAPQEDWRRFGGR